MNRRGMTASFRGSFSQLCTYIIVFMSMFIMFCSFNKNSLGTVCIVLTICLFLLNFKTKNALDMLPFMAFSAVVLALLYLSGNASERGYNAPINHALKFIYLAYTVALSVGMRKLENAYKIVVLKGTLSSIIISVLISLYNVIRVDKYAIRYYDERGFSNVVSFNQFYGICLVLCIMIFVLITWHKKYKVGKYIIFCMILLVCIGLSLYVTGVLICAFGIALGIFVNKYNQGKTKAAMWAIAILIALTFCFIFVNQVSDWIYKITEPLNYILRDRLRSVVEKVFRANFNMAYSYDRREELAGYSMNAFKQHPLFGVGYNGYGYGVIGCHQEWQDLLGVFGLVGTAIFIMLMLYFVQMTKNTIIQKHDLHSFYIAVVLFIILGFLNPCLSLPVLCAVFIISPNLSLIIPWWKD